MKQKQLTKPIESSTDNIRADAWNSSIKMVTMLYHWKLADGYEEIFRLIQLHQKWILQTISKQAVEVSREVFLQVQRDFTMFKGL